MKRGRKTGQLNQGSWNSWLVTFEVGERRYQESSLDKYAAAMRTINTPKGRRPASLDGMEFESSMFTAVSAKTLGVVRYLLCIERVK